MLPRCFTFTEQKLVDPGLVEPVQARQGLLASAQPWLVCLFVPFLACKITSCTDTYCEL